MFELLTAHFPYDGQAFFVFRQWNCTFIAKYNFKHFEIINRWLGKLRSYGESVGLRGKSVCNWPEFLSNQNWISKKGSGFPLFITTKSSVCKLNGSSLSLTDFSHNRKTRSGPTHLIVFKQFSYNYYITDSGKYNVYDGDCSGGLQSEDSVGKTRHTDMDCEERCLNDLNCAGFSFKIPFYSTYGEKECWTYSAILAEGDGARNKRCYMKKCKNNSFVFCNTLAALIRLANIWISHTFFSLVTWQQTEFLGK